MNEQQESKNQPSATALDAQGFCVGQRVIKIKGYEFYSTVRAVFTNEAGDTRLVCESILIPGMLHIFSPSQMQIANE